MAVLKTIRTVFFDVSDDLSAHIAEQISEKIRSKQIISTVHRRVLDYAGYYSISQANAEYIIRLEVTQESCKTRVCPLYVKYCTGNPRRDTTRSQVAEKLMEHHLQMIGYTPDMCGSELIPWENIKNFSWFWKSTAPYINLKVSCGTNKEKMLIKALSNGILSYFKR